MKGNLKILWFRTFHTKLIGGKHLHIMFDKIDGFIRVYDVTRYLVLFGAEKYDFIYNRVRYLIVVKSGITCVFSHNYAKINVDSYDSLSLEETLFDSIIMLTFGEKKVV